MADVVLRVSVMICVLEWWSADGLIKRSNGQIDAPKIYLEMQGHSTKHIYALTFSETDFLCLPI